MKKPILALFLSLMLLVTACAAPEPAPGTSPESVPEPESPSSVSEPALEPSSPAPEVSSSKPESAPETSSEPEPEPETSRSTPEIAYNNPDTSVDPEDWIPASAPEDPQGSLIVYLENNLTDEEYTEFYYKDDGIGIMTPKLERVKEIVAAYDGPSVEVEYCEAAYSRAKLKAAQNALHDFLKSQGLIANSSFPTHADSPRPGLVKIQIHQVSPALQNYLDTSEYKDCYFLNVTGGDFPLVNPDT